jgi:hypothetical protein
MEVENGTQDRKKFFRNQGQWMYRIQVEGLIFYRTRKFYKDTTKGKKKQGANTDGTKI